MQQYDQNVKIAFTNYAGIGFLKFTQADVTYFPGKVFIIAITSGALVFHPDFMCHGDFMWFSVLSGR